MKLSQAILRAVAVFVSISLLQLLAGVVAAIILPPKPMPNLAAHLLQWMLGMNALTIAVLAVVAVRSEWRGWQLGIAVAVIPAAITFVNGIEGVVFLPNSPIDWPRVFLTTGLTALFSVPVWMLLFGRRSEEPGKDQMEHFHPIASKPRSERAWKFVLSDFSYLVFYFIAGSIVFPYVKAFYATQVLPKYSTILGLELLIRGPVFVVLCLLLVRMLGLPRLSGALAVGAVFTILSGVVPLMMPNPFFPDAVRWAHFCEVTSSNFVFGAVVAWLWGRPRLTAPLALQHAA
ncbi:MAG TPA: hypothetical protein VMG31_12965 [Verrucomicrobiae bacterium]|nr:hypothetical protein [Verrucomicrobiae bacterium]